MLSFKTLKGVYAGLPVPWKENDDFDEDVYVRLINMLANYKVHGVYNGENRWRILYH